MGKGACIPYMSTPKLGGTTKSGQQRDAGRYGWVVGRTHTHSTLALASSYLPVLSPGDDLSFPFTFHLLYRTGSWLGQLRHGPQRRVALDSPAQGLGQLRVRAGSDISCASRVACWQARFAPDSLARGAR